ncbi:hypothetical protein BCR42DRAFT_414888 [Absidia repens]|uniref:Uncharacterized protein n=1 Tax=Absidia repens TaxID=90262 RepID=A0A1X2IGZ3_9FUNG|nr:hypothetical protein BCR42DRAFT_414888 [Absidia repens]
MDGIEDILPIGNDDGDGDDDGTANGANPLKEAFVGCVHIFFIFGAWLIEFDLIFLLL